MLMIRLDFEKGRHSMEKQAIYILQIPFSGIGRSIFLIQSVFEWKLSDYRRNTSVFRHLLLVLQYLIAARANHVG